MVFHVFRRNNSYRLANRTGISKPPIRHGNDRAMLNKEAYENAIMKEEFY